jgi:hypothetical protein
MPGSTRISRAAFGSFADRGSTPPHTGRGGGLEYLFPFFVAAADKIQPQLFSSQEQNY